MPSMPDGQDKGLANSIWARTPLNTGRSPYYFKRSTTTTVQVSHTRTFAAPQTTLSTTTINTTDNNGSLPARDGPVSSPQLLGTPNDNYTHTDLESALGRVPTPWAELARYTKIVRRLKWKLPFLAHGYNAATDKTYTGEQREEAELMFKLDFFEYYMLLERALVHLLGVFGIKVTGGFGDRLREAPGHHRQGDHRFHANVLGALDDPRNPLHEALGRSDVRSALTRAKELRNRWKNADDPDAALASRFTAAGSRAARPLEVYDLGSILDLIFAGSDDGFRIADRYVAEVQALAARRGVHGSADPPSEQTEEWEFMTDAMDWEAV